MTREENSRQRYEGMLSFFFRRWDEIIMVIDYDQTWELPVSPQILELVRRRGDIEYSIHGAWGDPQLIALNPGDIVKSMDDFGRKFIFVKTRLGVWAFFVVSKDVQLRHIANTREPAVCEFDKRPNIASALTLAQYIGDPNAVLSEVGIQRRNVGQRLEEIFKMLNDPTYRPKSITYFNPRKDHPV